MFSLEKLIEALGDTAHADRLEALAYNANPGACTADYWAHQYDQQANQVLVSVAKRTWSTNDDTSNLYGLEPNYGCCTANMHQGWPKFVSHMWMASPDNGLAAVAYGPSKVTAKVGDGEMVTITESTDYPWDGRITLKIELPKPTAFPLHLRIPSWATGATLKAAGESTDAKPGSFAVVQRTWKNGDTVVLDLPLKVRVERRWNDAATLHRGPIAYSLRIGEKWTKLKQHTDQFPVIDWQIEPTTPWNYGLIIDPANPESSVTVEQRRPGGVPFDHDRPPVVLRAKGRQIPSWKMEKHQAGETPASPVQSSERVTDLELVPYGSTRLRITEFPLLAE
jgi:DUF1680 family protein